MISILIPAYQTEDYIEECLDSIQNQEYLRNVDYEIIFGVDNCENVLNKLNQIKHKYKNLRIVFMKENYGLFITLNTLTKLAKYDNIIKFDSDDIMLPTLIQDIMSVDADLVRFKFWFYYGKDKPLKPFGAAANGVYRIKKHVYDIFGGYQPWQCAADTEFLYRFHQYGRLKEIQLNKELFLYRQHNHSLSNKYPFGVNPLRKQYHASFRGKRYVDFKITPITGEYKIID